MWQESPSEDLVSHIAGSGSSISPPSVSTATPKSTRPSPFSHLIVAQNPNRSPRSTPTPLRSGTRKAVQRSSEDVANLSYHSIFQ